MAVLVAGLLLSLHAHGAPAGLPGVGAALSDTDDAMSVSWIAHNPFPEWTVRVPPMGPRQPAQQIPIWWKRVAEIGPRCSVRHKVGSMVPQEVTVIDGATDGKMLRAVLPREWSDCSAALPRPPEIALGATWNSTTKLLVLWVTTDGWQCEAARRQGGKPHSQAYIRLDLSLELVRDQCAQMVAASSQQREAPATPSELFGQQTNQSLRIHPWVAHTMTGCVDSDDGHDQHEHDRDDRDDRGDDLEHERDRDDGHDHHGDGRQVDPCKIQVIVPVLDAIPNPALSFQLSNVGSSKHKGWKPNATAADGGKTTASTAAARNGKGASELETKAHWGLGLIMLSVAGMVGVVIGMKRARVARDNGASADDGRETRRDKVPKTQTRNASFQSDFWTRRPKATELNMEPLLWLHDQEVTSEVTSVAVPSGRSNSAPSNSAPSNSAPSSESFELLLPFLPAINDVVTGQGADVSACNTRNAHQPTSQPPPVATDDPLADAFSSQLWTDFVDEHNSDSDEFSSESSTISDDLFPAVSWEDLPYVPSSTQQWLETASTAADAHTVLHLESSPAGNTNHIMPQVPRRSDIRSTGIADSLTSTEEVKAGDSSTAGRKIQQSNAGGTLVTCTFPGCNYSVRSIGHLARHYRIHSQERPFRCNYPGCNYAAKQSAHAKTHMLTHLRTRPHKCPECDYSAKRKEHLTRHRKMHQ